MSFYRCDICDENGSPLCKDVTVNLEVWESRGGTQWFGTITASDVTGLVAGERYRLVLTDGRTGEFFVKRNTFAGVEIRSVSIEGTGALDQP